MLSDGAEFDNKPELEIFADDVRLRPWLDGAARSTRTRCSTRSRGIPKPEAERLLIEAFLGEAIETDRATKALTRSLRAWRARCGRLTRSEAPMAAHRRMSVQRPITAALRRRGDPRRLPDPVAAGERPAAGLSRQRRLGAEAAGGASTRMVALRWRRLRQRAPRPAHLANAATEAYEAARETVRALPQRRRADEIVFTTGGTEAINLVAPLVRAACRSARATRSCSR